MREPSLPEKVVAESAKNVGKTLWKICDWLYANDRKKDSCFFVNGESLMNILNQGGIYAAMLGKAALMRQCALLHAAASWRPTKDIVRFNDVLYDSLADSRFEGKAPGEILKRLPAWSVYIETPRGMACDGRSFSGFFATLFSDRMMSLVYPAENGVDSMSMLVPLDCDLSAGFLNVDTGETESADAKDFDEAKKMVSSSLSLVIYLCSYGFGDGQKYHDGSRSRVQVRRSKGAPRVFPAEHVYLRQPGAFFAAQLEEGLAREKRPAPSGAERAPVRPHMRRGHMHLHRVGPGRTDVIMKFHLPVMCALHNADKVKPRLPRP